ncbi:MAG: transporter substrate-binding domain-containing protein [Desulfuromonadaceae bacterium]|nr:transporter substrate-binding domain-containing protein [Desulfuromonadaceae bacterium]
MRILIVLLTRSAVVLFLLLAAVGSAFCRDLAEIKADGVLRHIGIPYANFVTGSDDGMDVELIKGFAKHIGVRYEYVRSDWGTVVGDLLGKKVRLENGQAVLGEDVPVKGDLIANGFTMLPWRQQILNFSTPTFPSQIWFIARAGSSIRPIKPTKLAKDIERVRHSMKGKNVLALPKTCLDPSLYNLEATGATVVCFSGNLNELAPALVNREAETTILDVPDALIALDKWPGKIKIIGPLSPPQLMGVGFAKNSPRLRDAFNTYFNETKRNGTYARLIKKYYPTAHIYFPDFFRNIK